METKTIAVEAHVEPSRREFEAYAAVFGNRDRANDIVHPGSFTKTLKEGPYAQGRVALKYNHDRLLGKLLSAKEDDHGLLISGRISKTVLGDEVLALMADGSLTTMSFKYEVPKGKSDKSSDGTRNIREVKLYEAGPVDPDLA